MKSRFVKIAFRVISSVLILYFLLKGISFSYDEFRAALSNLEFAWYLLSLPEVVVVLAVKSYRWKLITKGYGFSYPAWQAFRSYMSSYSVGVITPGRLGELIKMYNLKSRLPDIGSVTAFKTVVADRLFDLVFLLWFGISGALFYIFQFSTLIALIAGLLIIFTGFAILHLLLRINIINELFQRFKLLAFAIEMLKLLNGRQSVILWVITALAYLIFYFSILLILYSMDIRMSLIETGYMISIVGLVLLLPISVAGFGTREATLVGLFSLYGIAEELALSFSLLQFAAFFVWGGIVGYIFWLLEPVPLKMVKEDFKKSIQIIKR